MTDDTLVCDAAPATTAMADLGVLADHFDRHLREWVDGWTVAGRPVAAHVAAVEVVCPAGAFTVTFNGAHTLPTGGGSTERADAMFEDVWHPAWEEACETLLTLDGPWLHPETRWLLDPYAIASYRSALMIGCVDRDDPTAPRRFDAASDPVMTEQDVVSFPVSPGAVLNATAAGFAGNELGVAVAATLMFESGVHEGFELFQRERGVPVFDPHDRSLRLAGTLVLSDGTRLELHI